MIYKTLSLSLLLSSMFLVSADELISSATVQETTVQAPIDSEVSITEFSEEQSPFELPADQEFRSYYDSLTPEQQQDCVKFGEELTAALTKSVEKLQDLINRCDALQKIRGVAPKGGTIKIQITSKAEGNAVPELATIDAVLNDPMNNDLTTDAKNELKNLLEQTIAICKDAEKDVQEVAQNHPAFKSKYTDGLAVSLLVSSPTNMYVLKA
jgi:hypothetical protein